MSSYIKMIILESFIFEVLWGSKLHKSAQRLEVQPYLLIRDLIETSVVV